MPEAWTPPRRGPNRNWSAEEEAEARLRAGELSELDKRIRDWVLEKALTLLVEVDGPDPPSASKLSEIRRLIRKNDLVSELGDIDEDATLCLKIYGRLTPAKGEIEDPDKMLEKIADRSMERLRVLNDG